MARTFKPTVHKTQNTKLKTNITKHYRWTQQTDPAPYMTPFVHVRKNPIKSLIHKFSFDIRVRIFHNGQPNAWWRPLRLLRNYFNFSTFISSFFSYFDGFKIEMGNCVNRVNVLDKLRMCAHVYPTTAYHFNITIQEWPLRLYV